MSENRLPIPQVKSDEDEGAVPRRRRPLPAMGSVCQLGCPAVVFSVPERNDMKKFVVFSSLVLMASVVCCTVGCGSAGGCFSRNGSRVPVASGSNGTPISSTPVAAAPIMDGQMVYSSGCNACNAVRPACNPCGAATCGACDPCGSSSSGYPMGGTMPGPAGN